MKILYLTHVCWEWIFQRPQILEKMLENDYECDVLNKRYILRPVTTKNNVKPQKMILVYQLPMSNKFDFIRKINKWLYKVKLNKIAQNYDAIWACYPEVGACIPKNYKGKIIYDCMDNHVAMARDHVKEEIGMEQSVLINRADIVYATSQKLREVVPGLNQSILVRNGYTAMIPTYKFEEAKKEKYQVGYFGTVAPWFDFELLYDSLHFNDKIEYHIIGPLDNGFDEIDMDRDKRVIFEGVVEHKNLQKYVKDYDVMIMPFKINDIILSVDPVKLYEYICMGKCIVSVWYPELEHFAPYVYFYNDLEEYNELMKQLEEICYRPKYTQDQQMEFLGKNTWEERYKVIKQSLSKIEETV